MSEACDEERSETPKAEKSVACVTVSADSNFLPPLTDFLRQMVHRLGLADEDAERLNRVVEVICRNVIERAFEPDEDGWYDVCVLRRPGQVAIAVEDRGLPFDYARFRDGSDTTLADMLHQSFADETRFINLGRRGNRVELVKYLPYADVREQLSEDEHHRTVRASVASEDSPLEIRMMRPDESGALSRCVYRSYGYSYDWDDIYYPDHIRELQESGLMRSCVVVSAGDEIVAHLAVMLEHPGSTLGEAGQAVVDPRFRAHRLFERMKTYLETGYLLGYIPASVSYKEIGEERAGRRGSIALVYLRVSEEPERNIYPPTQYRDVISRLVEYNGLRRNIVDVPASDAQSEVASSRMNVSVRRDHNLAFLRVIEPGANLRELIRLQLGEGHARSRGLTRRPGILFRLHDS